MEADTMHINLVARARMAAALALLAVLAGVSPASAQFEFTGSWNPLVTEDLANDSVPVDYMGLPLNEEARTRALSYSESQLGMVEHQCEMWTPPYLLSGPFGLRVSAELEPIKGTVLSYTIAAWPDRSPTVIWMDGRPHPSKYAPHPRSGFTAGRWEGNTLVTVTTHMKLGMVRKNGPPMSDEAVMTIRYFRHGDILTMLAVIEDPIFLTEPLMLSRTFEAARQAIPSQVLTCITTDEGTPAGEVPHHDPANHPYANELVEKYGVPKDAVLGYPETLYPEYRQEMNK